MFDGAAGNCEKVRGRPRRKFACWSRAPFDVLKGRQAYFRTWDHQLVQEAYPFTVKPKGEIKDQLDMLRLGPAVPAADVPLETIYPTKEQNPCSL